MGESQRKEYIRIWAARLIAMVMLGTMAVCFVYGKMEVGAGYAELQAKEQLVADNEEAIASEREELHRIAEDQEILAIILSGAGLDILSQPTEESGTICRLPIGTTVMIRDVELELTENEAVVGKIWYCVRFFSNDTEYYGYVPRGSVMTADERFLAWEQKSTLISLSQQTNAVKTRKMLKSASNPMSANPAGVSEGDTVSEGDESGTVSAGDNATTGYPDIDLFPESYWDDLVELKKSHPLWYFVPFETEIEWDTAIANEIDGAKSLVHRSLADCMKEGEYEPGNWYYASEEALKYYMDPRNGLTEDRIFQFELLSYNETYHTQDALSLFLNHTFMNDSQNAPKTDMTFSFIFWAIGKEMGVSPFHLAARVYQEQGQGDSPLISGVEPGYEGYYNYFNISATGQTREEVIRNGLEYAKSHNWDNAYGSLLKGSEFISQNYIQKQQDTLYLQKFNVSANRTFGHQYMQNISAPTTEAMSIRKLYDRAGSLDNTFIFKIPVYENMPDAPCARPESSTNVVLSVPDGYIGSVYLDGVEYSGVTRNGQLIIAAPDSTRTNAVMYRYNGNGVPVGMYLWTLDYVNHTYVETPQPLMEDLLSYHGFSVRITGKAGIRFKTGISEKLKQSLISSGVNGYKLVECGTLVMTNANRVQYPLVKGGEKVKSGISYGKETDGRTVDKVFETVDGRQRFTSVLVGLPAAQYQTEFAFRGYAVLEKDGKQMTVYGPIQARSIYKLAKQVLSAGSYPEGSDSYQFLKKLIEDADALQ